jgi:hypothetical protein
VFPLEEFIDTHDPAAVLLGTFSESETALALAGLAAHRG